MPQRFLKPGITTSAKWNSCDWMAQSFYIRLITLVDDYGRYDGRAALLRSQAFPIHDNIDVATVSGLCDQIHKAGLAVFFRKNGKEYLALTAWTERPRGVAKYPEFDDSCEQVFASCEQVLSNVGRILPPSSSSSSSSSPASASLGGVGVLPPSGNFCPSGTEFGLPNSEEQAVQWSSLDGVPAEFAIKTYHRLNGRSWKEYGTENTLITNWRSTCKSRWLGHMEAERAKAAKKAEREAEKAAAKEAKPDPEDEERKFWSQDHVIPEKQHIDPKYLPKYQRIP